MIIYRRTIALSLALLAILVAGAAPPTPQPYALAAGATPLASSPAALSADMALGSTQKLSLSLQNTSASPLTPRLYEANPASPLASALTAAVPAELAAVALPDQAERVDPRLSALAAADPGAPTDFLVFLGDQADLSAAYAISDWSQRGQYVYATLRDHAASSQAALRSLLDARGVSYTPLWIVNALVVRGDAADMAAIAARSEVAMLRADELTSFGDTPAADATTSAVANCLPDAANVCWNLTRIGADRAWNYFGARGAGITVANIDSGVTYSHPALVGQYRGNTGSGFDHNYNWYDSYAGTRTPVDSGNHGTHTMGTIVASGGASADAPAVGVAPGARWIAARACGAIDCSNSGLIMAAQWMLAPTDLDGDNPRPDLRPQIVSNSWSSGVGGNNWYAGYVAAWRAAGIFPVFAAGNNPYGFNSTCSTINSPGDYAQVVGVGALDSANKLAGYSQIGPTTDGRLKPDITAPGSGIASTYSNLSYSSMNGTSMATPHVAGSVALLWSANPDLIGDYDRTYQILISAAAPISGDTRFDGSAYSLCRATGSPNNIYGYGRLDAYAAVAAATVDVPWLILPAGGIGPIDPGASASFEVTIDTHYVPGPGTYQARILAHSADLTLEPLVIQVTLTVGDSQDYATLSGKVTRATGGSPLAGTVTVANGPSVTADSSGAYKIVLPPAASYTLTASAFGYIAQAASVTLGEGEARSYDFALYADTPRLNTVGDLLTTTVTLGSVQEVSYTLRNIGSQALTYSASLSEAYYGVWRSSQADGPAATWITPPADAVTVGLADDGVSALIDIGFAFPYFNQSYSTLSIGANGFLSFGTASGSSYIGGCLPLSETPRAALAALRVDLDPAQAGARVSYARTADGFLVSWEDVPLFGSAGQPLSFQALLRPDGRVTLNYKQLGALTSSNLASVGLQRSNTSAQSLGCGSSLSLSDGQTIELRPQPDVTGWATLPSPSGSIPPGGQVSLPVRLSWARSSRSWPASADILLTTNDPDRISSNLTARMTSPPAEQTMFMPIVFR